ncbi:hypothetical protein [Saccharopolyspora taberi]|uniref:Uncharacterized protein n=1 Tax=Saccharopolyspora taberi TaxID=60895 RepID=A0ABN3VNR4_9PSEU
MDSNRQTGNPAEAAEFSPDADRRPWWRVHCRDATNVHRDLDVLVNRDRVVLVGPPGAAAVLSTSGVGELSRALRSAADQARK